VARAGTFALSGVTLGDNAREFLEDIGGGKCFMFVIIALQRHEATCQTYSCQTKRIGGIIHADSIFRFVALGEAKVLSVLPKCVTFEGSNRPGIGRTDVCTHLYSRV
jgi:hypothetical protein